MAKKNLTPGGPKPDRQWEIEDAMRTLARAAQIRRDAKMMADVRSLAKDVSRAAGRAPAKAK